MTATAALRAHLRSVRTNLMTGVSVTIPFATIGGVFLAAGHATGGDGALDRPGTLAWFLAEIGRTGLTLMVPVLGAYVAFAIADRPGLAPGFVLSLLVQQGAIVEQAGRLVGLEVGATGAGYLGALGVGLVAGTVVARLGRVDAPSPVEPLVPVLLVPVLGTALLAPVALFVLAPPLALANEWLTALARDAAGVEALALGAALGAMMALDMGGPINKFAYVYAVLLLSEGVTEPMAAVMVAGMTPPLGLTVSNALSPATYPRELRERVGRRALLGLAFVTEGAIPYAEAVPVRVTTSAVLGSAVAGGVVLLLGVGMPAPHGGALVAPLASDPLAFLACLTAGTVTTAAVATVLVSAPSLAADSTAGGRT